MSAANLEGRATARHVLQDGQPPLQPDEGRVVPDADLPADREISGGAAGLVTSLRWGRREPQNLIERPAMGPDKPMSVSTLTSPSFSSSSISIWR